MTHSVSIWATATSCWPGGTWSPTLTAFLATTPGHRRAHLRVAEVQLRLVELRLGQLQVGLAVLAPTALRVSTCRGAFFLHLGEAALGGAELRLLLRDPLARPGQRLPRRLHLRGRRLGGGDPAIEVGARDRLRLPELLAALPLDLRQPRVPLRLGQPRGQLVDVLLGAGEARRRRQDLRRRRPAIAAVLEVSVIDTLGSSACSCASAWATAALACATATARSVGSISSRTSPALTAGSRRPGRWSRCP